MGSQPRIIGNVAGRALNIEGFNSKSSNIPKDRAMAKIKQMREATAKDKRKEAEDLGPILRT